MFKGPVRFAPALVLASVHLAQAADIEAKSRIDAVTVYPDAAMVTRVVEAELPPGASVLVLKGLPAGLDPASLRVTGESAGALAIGAVESRIAPPEAPVPDTALETRIKGLRGEREAQQVGIDVLGQRQAMMLRYAQANPEKLGGEGKPLEIAQWTAAFDAISAGMAKTGEELRLANAHARELDDAIRALEASRQRPPAKTGPVRDISVALEAGAAQSAKLSLTYRIAGAGWQPLYDARLDTGGAGRAAALELVRRAAVTQRTGEDWTEVTLGVSTVRSLRGTAAPEVQPQRLAFFEPYAAGSIAPAVPAPPLARAKQAENRPDADALSTAPAPQSLAKPALEQQTTLDAGAFQAAFQVPGRVTVSADGAAKTFLLLTQRPAAALIAKTSPALDQTAYLEARFVNDEAAPILPGKVAIFRDGAYSGAGSLPLVAPGEATDLGFGADDRIKVARVPVRKKENEPGWFGQTKIETREFKTSVKNLHDFAVKVVVVDQMPFSENTAIVVEQLDLTTPPTEKTVGDKRGVLGWTFDLKPGDAKDIRLGYRLKWPADRDVRQEAAPLAK